MDNGTIPGDYCPPETILTFIKRELRSREATLADKRQESARLYQEITVLQAEISALSASLGSLKPIEGPQMDAVTERKINDFLQLKGEENERGEGQ